MESDIVLIVVAVIGGAATVVAAWRAGKASEHTPYAVLASRVVALENADQENRKRIARLENRENLLVAYLRRVLDWVEAGAKPPPPEPPEDIAYLFGRRRIK